MSQLFGSQVRRNLGDLWISFHECKTITGLELLQLVYEQAAVSVTEGIIVRFGTSFFSLVRDVYNGGNLVCQALK